MPGGRKSLKDEVRMFERYSELSIPYFRVLKTRLESGIKEDENWATEILTKAFVKMIPQETELSGKDGAPIPILTITNVSVNDGNQQNSPDEEANQGSTGGDISQQDNLDTPIVDQLSPKQFPTHSGFHSVGELPPSEAGSDEGLPVDNGDAPILQGQQVE